MKLLKKFRYYTYLGLVSVIAVSSLSIYIVFKASIFNSADEVINDYRKDIEDLAIEKGSLVPLLSVNSRFGHIEKVNDNFDFNTIDDRMVDTLAFDHYQNEYVIYRKMLFPVQAEDGKYVVRLMLPTIDHSDLIKTVVITLLIFALLFVVFTYAIDILFLKNIFIPFEKILCSIRNYNIDTRPKIQKINSNIDEFEELNDILVKMTETIDERYVEMKDFLEYTSHELQTPLSVIQLKIESIETRNSDNFELLQSTSSILKSLKRAIHFNRSILFIAKISNNQFSEREKVNLTVLIQNQINQYQELFSMNNITVSYDQCDDFNLYLHPQLAEHLIQNLLTNAIKHNCYGGAIHISLSPDEFILSNTYAGTIPKGDLFEKYKYSKKNINSSGLGMSIVKAICEKNKIDVNYRIKDNFFIIKLSAKK